MLYWTILYPKNFFDLDIQNLFINTIILVSISSLVLIIFSFISNYGNRISKSKFLSIFGINERTENLINKSNNLKQKEKIENDFLRLTSYNQMGELYKCIIFSDVDLNLPF